MLEKIEQPSQTILSLSVFFTVVVFLSFPSLGTNDLNPPEEFNYFK